jgi:hypothetical protein
MPMPTTIAETLSRLMLSNISEVWGSACIGPSRVLNETRDLGAQVEEPECRLVTIRPEVEHLCLQ